MNSTNELLIGTLKTSPRQSFINIPQIPVKNLHLEMSSTKLNDFIQASMNSISLNKGLLIDD